uniref:Uncharacterized protein n=1 Tax=Anguilla anguilla TaxID=7936 RepID=A0A0E9X661_ANGAN
MYTEKRGLINNVVSITTESLSDMTLITGPMTSHEFHQNNNNCMLEKMFTILPDPLLCMCRQHWITEHEHSVSCDTETLFKRL